MANFSWKIKEEKIRMATVIGIVLGVLAAMAVCTKFFKRGK